MPSVPSRHLPLLIVLAAIAAAAGLWFGDNWFSRHGKRVEIGGSTSQGAARLAAPDVSPNVLIYPQPRTMAPFALQRADGRVISNEDLRGGWTLVFFGFTNCPDVCPTALATFKQIEKLNAGTDGKPALPLRFWFVSVDPDRDTPKVLGEYTAYFSPSIVAATSTPEELERFARDAGVVFVKVSQGESDYTIDHSAQLTLFNPDGRLHAIVRPPHDPAAVLTDVRRIAAAGGA